MVQTIKIPRKLIKIHRISCFMGLFNCGLQGIGSPRILHHILAGCWPFLWSQRQDVGSTHTLWLPYHRICCYLSVPIDKIGSYRLTGFHARLKLICYLAMLRLPSGVHKLCQPKWVINDSTLFVEIFAHKLQTSKGCIHVVKWAASFL